MQYGNSSSSSQQCVYAAESTKDGAVWIREKRDGDKKALILAEG